MSHRISQLGPSPTTRWRGCCIPRQMAKRPKPQKSVFAGSSSAMTPVNTMHGLSRPLRLGRLSLHVQHRVLSRSQRLSDQSTLAETAFALTTELSTSSATVLFTTKTSSSARNRCLPAPSTAGPQKFDKRSDCVFGRGARTGNSALFWPYFKKSCRGATSVKVKLPFSSDAEYMLTICSGSRL